MNLDTFIRPDVLEARKKGLIICPCKATYSRFLKRCPNCGRPSIPPRARPPNPTKFK